MRLHPPVLITQQLAAPSTIAQLRTRISEREQGPRNSVMHRKVTVATDRTGASAIITTLLTTARKRGQNLFAVIRAVAESSPL